MPEVKDRAVEKKQKKIEGDYQSLEKREKDTCRKSVRKLYLTHFFIEELYRSQGAFQLGLIQNSAKKIRVFSLNFCEVQLEYFLSISMKW